MPYGTNDLLHMSAVELDALFAQSPPGPIPNGDAKGTAILDPGSPHAAQLAEIGSTLWQGKTFNAQTKTLQNRVTAFGVKAFAADVYEDKSLFDDKQCIVIDYSKGSEVVKPVRDEIRLIAPGMYLGRIYWNGEYRGYFALQLQDMAATRWRRRFQALLALVIGIPLLIAILLAMRFLPTRSVTYTSPEDHFKYGSTGGFISGGFPYWIWRAMPVVFKDRLPNYYPYTPGKEYEAFGLVYEPGHDVPIGIQKGRNIGIDRVFLNCSACHHGTVRMTPDGPAKVYLGMPAERFDIGAFQRFLFDIGKDSRFDCDHIIPEIERQAGRLGPIDRYLVYPIAITVMQQKLIALGTPLERTHPENFGPGRNDTFNPEKGVWGFPMKELPDAEFDAKTDFPSIWNQGKRKHRDDGKPMELHWDGNNDDVTERNKNAAFASGTIPSTVDLASLERIVQWNWDLKAPAYPFPIDQALAAQGAPIYRQYCAYCHGKNGQDFSGEYVGKVTDIEKIGTDRHRLDSFTYELAVNLGTPYAGEPYRFKHFHKTYGYANAPLDGIWLRAPYLHNGSVPTLRDLLNPPCTSSDPNACKGYRPPHFYRGNDLYDRDNVGFVSNMYKEKMYEGNVYKGERTYFLFDTNVPGNGNGGHSGYLYGTQLPEEAKKALLEYLKTF